MTNEQVTECIRKVNLAVHALKGMRREYRDHDIRVRRIVDSEPWRDGALRRQFRALTLERIDGVVLPLRAVRGDVIRHRDEDDPDVRAFVDGLAEAEALSLEVRALVAEKPAA